MENLDDGPSLLIASPQLQDPNFAKTVVLLAEHHSEGAMGFIVNRPSQLPVAALLADPAVPMPANIASWHGGPVGTEQGIILHAEPIPGSQDRHSLISSSPEAIEALAGFGRRHNDGSSAPIATSQAAWLYPYRFIVGYAGWGAGQLEEEMVEGGWLQLPLDRSLLFNTPWLNIWPCALERLGISTANFAPSPHSYVH